jgi:hypothetical protein
MKAENGKLKGDEAIRKAGMKTECLHGNPVKSAGC